MAAFALALAQGADGVELDVRPTADGEIVVFHDADLARMANDPRQVASLAGAALRAIELRGGERVPRLTEVLDLVLGAGKFVNVEIKPDVPDLAASVAAVAAILAARNADELGRLIVSSFAREAIEHMHARLPPVAVAFLFADENDALPAMERGWHAHPRHTLANEVSIQRWKREGRVVNTWTVNDAADARRLGQAGIDGIITDDVPLVFAALAE